MNEERQKKIFLIKIGVISIMIVILVLWIFNLKNIFSSQPAGRPEQNEQQWSQIKTDLSKTMAEVSDRLNKIEAKNRATQQASDAFVTDFVAATNKLASSTAASSTASLATSSTATSTELVPKE